MSKRSNIKYEFYLYDFSFTFPTFSANKIKYFYLRFLENKERVYNKYINRYIKDFVYGKRSYIRS